MSLVSCPDCHTQISTAALQCPHCGFPLAGGKVPAPRVRTVVSTRFALAATGILGFIGFFPLAMEGEPEGLVFTAFFTWAMVIPVWWKARRKNRQVVVNSEEIERRVDARLEEAEDRMRAQLVEMEERVDFAERLLTRYRDDQLGKGS